MHQRSWLSQLVQVSLRTGLVDEDDATRGGSMRHAGQALDAFLQYRSAQGQASREEPICARFIPNLPFGLIRTRCAL